MRAGLAAYSIARAAGDPPGRRCGGAAGLAQGARAPRLSVACAARRVAQPALRAAVGRPERSARRAALVPQQAQEHRRRAGPATGRHAAATPSSSTLPDCFVDALEIARATQEGIETLPPDRLRTLAALFDGEFLDGLEIDRNPAFNAWLTAQRRRFRSLPRGPAGASCRSGAGDEVFGYLEKWLELAPFDLRVHEMLLDAFARRGRIREGEEHLAATARLFEAEGLDHAPIREAWRAARAQGRRRAKVQAAPRPLRTGAGVAARESVAAASRRASIAVMPFVDARRGDGARRPGRRSRPRRDHPARQAAQPFRHRARHRLRPQRATRSARKRPAGC